MIHVSLSKCATGRICSHFVIEDTDAQRELAMWPGTWSQGLNTRQVGFPLQLSMTALLQSNQTNVAISLVGNG